jgi:hypothetical protein
MSSAVRRAAATALGLWLGSAPLVRAQEQPRMSPWDALIHELRPEIGLKVELSEEERGRPRIVRGRAIAWSDSSLTLRASAPTARLELERRRIRRVGVLRGHRVGLAAVVGAAVGALAVGVTVATVLPLEGTSRAEAFAGGALVGAPLGGLAGAVVGTQIGSYEWYDAGRDARHD